MTECYIKLCVKDKGVNIKGISCMINYGWKGGKKIYKWCMEIY